MLDLPHLPPSSKAVQQIFYCNGFSGNSGWQTWLKPRGVSFVHFFALGGGGGGGSGAAVSNAGSAGGGSGGSGAQCSLIFPAADLPDVLYISVGFGGAAGVAGAGGIGFSTYVTIYPATTVNYILCQANGAGAGTSGNGTTAGLAGGPGTATTIANAPLAGLAFPAWGTAATNISLAGQAGVNGGAGNGAGAGSAGTAVFINGGTTLANGTGLLVTAGAGGGGLGTSAGAAGGTVTVPAGAVYPPHPGGAAGSGTGSGANGLHGYQAIPKLMLFYGGSGGGSSGNTGGSGGNGGRGGYGCGGGGGGGGFTGGTRSTGGEGGDGLVIATAW